MASATEFPPGTVYVPRPDVDDASFTVIEVLNQRLVGSTAVRALGYNAGRPPQVIFPHPETLNERYEVRKPLVETTFSVTLIHPDNQSWLIRHVWESIKEGPHSSFADSCRVVVTDVTA